MLSFLRSHPYMISFIIVFLLLFFIGIFALDSTWGEALLGSAVISAVGLGSIWWKMEGFG